MSQNRRNNRQAAYDKVGNIREDYVYGSAARRLQPRRQDEPAKPGREPVKHQSPQGASVRKNRARARYMTAGYVAFLAVALCAAAFVLVNYIQLQTELTNLTRSIASKEIEVNNLRMANDEEYNRILSSIDLEEIKRIAMGELGMVYAEEGQIILYGSTSSDYMRQVTEEGR